MNESTNLPLTLRQMAGAPVDSPLITDSALLVIDAQREYLDGLIPLPAIGPALDRTVDLLKAARLAGSPVIHVAHTGKPGGAFDPAAGGRIIDRVAPLDGESVVVKALPNAFAGTDLLAMLSGFGHPHLIVCGFMTHMCVSSTIRASLDLGLATTVVSDATATRDLPSPDGNGILPHDQLHLASIAALSDRFAIVAETSDLVG